MINQKTFQKLAVVFALSILPVAVASAATISFSPAVTIDLTMPSQVVNTGSILRAYSFGSLIGSTFNVNGVTFSSFAGQTTDTTTFPTANAFSVFAPNMTNSYGALMNSAFFSDGNVSATISLNGLTVGQAYQVQFFVYDSRGVEQNRSENFGGGSPSVQFGLGSPSAGGQFAIGTFTADNATQSLDLFFTRDIVVQANALTLSAVPEPSTYALLGIGAVAIFGLARRRKLSA